MTKSNVKRASKLARVAASAALALACSGAIGATSATYTPLAGGWSGDAGQAKSANLHGVADVVVDGAGNLYVAQAYANRIRKIAPNGTITTLAGGHTQGFSGDGGLASKALINQPGTLAVDTLGNLYFGDAGNRIRKIATNGVITTIAGNGKAEFAGDGGQAKSASFAFIAGIAVDKSGNVYAADYTAHRIRKIATNGVITTIAGNGQPSSGVPADSNNVAATSVGINEPIGVDVDLNGNVWFVTAPGEVYRIAPNGVLTRRVDLAWPANDIKVNATGATVYVGGQCYIDRISAGNNTTTRYAGPECAASPDGTPATGANFWHMSGITVDAAGNVYGAETEAQRVIKLSGATPTITRVAGGILPVAQGQLGATAPLTWINALAVDNAHNVFFADAFYARRIRKFANGRVFPFAGNGENVTCTTCYDPMQVAFPRPTGVAIGNAGDVYVADRAYGLVWRLQNGGMSQVTYWYDRSYIIDGNPGTDIKVDPRGIATDSQGTLYIADYGHNRIVKITANTQLGYRVAGAEGVVPNGDGGLAKNAGVIGPTALTVDGTGNVYFYESTGAVRKVGTDGIIRRFAGVYAPTVPTGDTTIALNHKLTAVTGLAVHASGLWMVDAGIVKRVRPNGRIETVPGLTGEAYGVAIKHNTLYISTRGGRLLSAPITQRIVANDFNGDRRSDVFWRGSTGVNALWLSADNTTKLPAATLATENVLVAQGDFDGDGQSDLLWRNTINGNNIVWRSGNANTQMILTAMPDQAWQVAGAGDFNGDGKSDVVWRHKTSGANAIWLGGNSKTTHPTSSLTDLRWVVAGIGDFDGDGRSDLFWRNTQSGSNTIWSGANASIRKVRGGRAINFKVVGVGDFNGDSVSDIAWRDAEWGQVSIWNSGESANAVYGEVVSDKNMKIAAIGDYDNDGVDDMLWRNALTGANTLWKNGVASTPRALGSLGSSWKVAPYEAQP